MSNPTVRLAQQRLAHNGFRPGPADGLMGPQTRAAIHRFQSAFNGIPGRQHADRRLPLTGTLDNSTRVSLSYNGRLSQHFWAREFACRHCGTVVLSRDLVSSLEVYRRLLGGPLRIVSGYRCPVHNRRVGGATNSQHLHGRAADIPAQVHVSTVRHHLRHGGLGFQGSTGRVRHIDVGPTRSWRY